MNIACCVNRNCKKCMCITLVNKLMILGSLMHTKINNRAAMSKSDCTDALVGPSSLMLLLIHPDIAARISASVFAAAVVAAPPTKHQVYRPPLAHQPVAGRHQQQLLLKRQFSLNQHSNTIKTFFEAAMKPTIYVILLLRLKST